MDDRIRPARFYYYAQQLQQTEREQADLPPAVSGDLLYHIYNDLPRDYAPKR